MRATAFILLTGGGGVHLLPLRRDRHALAAHLLRTCGVACPPPSQKEWGVPPRPFPPSPRKERGLARPSSKGAGMDTLCKSKDHHIYMYIIFRLSLHYSHMLAHLQKCGLACAPPSSKRWGRPPRPPKGRGGGLPSSILKAMRATASTLSSGGGDALLSKEMDSPPPTFPS